MTRSRRDFLKLAAAASLGALTVPGALHFLDHERAGADRPNIYIFLFDTLAARHMSLYGYPRLTTPNMDRFAQRANVYHRHYAGSNFTTSGTAALLTGTLPWTNRALGQAGLIAKGQTENNLFSAVGNSLIRVGWSQNIWSEILLEQMEQDIDEHVAYTEFNLASGLAYSNQRPARESLEVYRSADEFLYQNRAQPGSLFFSFLKDFDFALKVDKAQKEHLADYPRGIPNQPFYNLYFTLEQTFDGVTARIQKTSAPAFGYFHFLSPHEPYFPRKDFIGIFDDDWTPVPKPLHPLAEGRPDEELNGYRREYDEYVAHVDAEFGRMMDALEKSGRLKNSYVIVTSDHGQSFERGLHGHTTPLMYEPLLHIPLLISAPGQTTRNDFHIPTSCIDLLPTLATLVGRLQPELGEGTLLPGFGGVEDESRPIFSLEAKMNPIYSPLRFVTVVMVKGDYKMIWYGDYPGYNDVYELYDLRADPEELNDLRDLENKLAQSMREELRQTLQERDQYQPATRR
ncbi:MAG: sulfatase-like hydrolase/transferase [Chloroflexota bacterium]